MFPNRRGQAAERRTVVRTLRRLLAMPATEHSMRREGSQLYARRGLVLYLIQFLGRWGTNTVSIYVAEALREQLTRAASSAAGGVPAPPPTGDPQLRKTLKQLVDEAVAERLPQASPDQAQDAPLLHVALAAAADVPGAPNAPTAQRIRRLLGGRETGEVHDAVVIDEALPREAWTTRCSWKFGLGPHVIRNDLEVTCARCIARRAVESRRLLSA